jgi:hypothetical protein
MKRSVETRDIKVQFYVTKFFGATIMSQVLETNVTHTTLTINYFVELP